MSFLRSARPLQQALFRGSAAARQFHTSPRVFIKVGDSIPKATLKEDSPGNSVDIAAEISKLPKAVIVGVPAAFSPACSSTHVPSYVAHKDIKNTPVFVVSVNDPFVTGAWKDSIEGAKESGIRFLADPAGEFAIKMGMDFEKSIDIFGTLRNKRYAVVVENGEVKKIFEEPDNTGVNETTAENVL